MKVEYDFHVLWRLHANLDPGRFYDVSGEHSDDQMDSSSACGGASNAAEPEAHECGRIRFGMFGDVLLLDMPIPRTLGCGDFELYKQKFQAAPEHGTLGRRNIVMITAPAPVDNLHTISHKLHDSCVPHDIYFDVAIHGEGPSAWVSVLFCRQIQNVRRNYTCMRGLWNNTFQEAQCVAWIPVLEQSGGRGQNEGCYAQILSMRGNLNPAGMTTMRFQNMGPGSAEVSFETCCEQMKHWTPADFSAHIANSKLAKSKKKATAFQESLLTMHVELKQYVELRHRASSMIMPMDDDRHYDIPRDFVEGALDLQGVHYNDATGKVELVTLKTWLESKLCREKTCILIGTERTGKSEVQHAIARHMCRRSFANGAVQKPVYYYSSALDPLGVLSREGALATCSAICVKDSDLCVLMNSKLSREELKDVVYSKEAASHRARYHPAIWPSRTPRTMSWNCGKGPDGSVDWGYNLRKVGLDALDVLTQVDTVADAAIAEGLIGAQSSDERAIVSRVVLFKVSTKLYKTQNREDEEQQDNNDIEAELKAEQAYYEWQKQHGAL